MPKESTGPQWADLSPRAKGALKKLDAEDKKTKVRALIKNDADKFVDKVPPGGTMFDSICDWVGLGAAARQKLIALHAGRKAKKSPAAKAAKPEKASPGKGSFSAAEKPTLKAIDNKIDKLAKKVNSIQQQIEKEKTSARPKKSNAKIAKTAAAA